MMEIFRFIYNPMLILFPEFYKFKKSQTTIDLELNSIEINKAMIKFLPIALDENSIFQ
jgi:hypothetical protein